MHKAQTGIFLAGMAVASVLLLAACDRSANAEAPAYATVVSSVPVKETVSNSHQECHDEVVMVAKPVKDEHRVVGSAIGAVVGGLVGNQVGGGRGKDLATVAGAIGGGVAGNQVQRKRQQTATEPVTKRVCKTVDNPSTRVVGYDVTYEYDGKEYTTRMDHEPGQRIAVEETVHVVDQ